METDMQYLVSVTAWAVKAINDSDFIPAHFVLWELELRGVDSTAIMEV